VAIVTGAGGSEVCGVEADPFEVAQPASAAASEREISVRRWKWGMGASLGSAVVPIA
jgi:hypothetical protein